MIDLIRPWHLEGFQLDTSGNPSRDVIVFLPQHKDFRAWCHKHGLNPVSEKVHLVKHATAEFHAALGSAPCWYVWEGSDSAIIRQWYQVRALEMIYNMKEIDLLWPITTGSTRHPGTCGSTRNSSSVRGRRY